jgi:hypothetical protein
MTGAGSGDRLARGSVKADFGPPNTTPEKWAQAFNDFDPEKFKKEGMPKAEEGLKEVSRT